MRILRDALLPAVPCVDMRRPAVPSADARRMNLLMMRSQESSSSADEALGNEASDAHRLDLLIRSLDDEQDSPSAEPDAHEGDVVVYDDAAAALVVPSCHDHFSLVPWVSVQDGAPVEHHIEPLDRDAVCHGAGFFKVLSQIADRPATDRDPDTLAVAEFLGKQSHESSIAAAAADTGVTKYMFKVTRRLLCSCMLVAERWLRLTLHHVFSTAPGYAQLFYLEIVHHDATDMKSRHQGEAHTVENARSVAIADAGMSLAHFRKCCGYKPSTSAGMGKIMQTDSSFVALLRAPNGQLLEFHGKGLAWVQLVENTTGRTLCKAQNAYDLVGSTVDTFQSKLRLAVLDGGSSNLPSDQNFVRNFRVGFRAWAVSCFLHMVALCFKHCFKLKEGSMVECYHLAKAFEMLSHMIELKEDLRSMLASQVVFAVGTLSDGAISYRVAVIKLLIPENSDYSRAVGLLTIFYSDWRVPVTPDSPIVILVPPDVAADEARFASFKKERMLLIQNRGVNLLLPRAFNVYNKAKWYGTVASLQGPAVLLLMHRFLDSILPTWLRRRAPARGVGLPRSALALGDGMEDPVQPPGCSVCCL